MSQSAAVPVSARGPAAPGGSETRLRGRWLRLVRIGCLAVAGLDLALFIGSLPAYFEAIDRVCRTASCNRDQLTPDAAQRLHALGLSLDFFAWYTLGVYGLFIVGFAVVGLVLFWRKPADPTALVAAFAFLTFPITLINVTSALPAFWWLPAQVVNSLGGSAMALLFYVFPDGLFVPRWTRWLWALFVIGPGAYTFYPPSPLLNLLVRQYLVSALIASLVAVQIYRYVRVSTPVERQQTKWVVIGITVAFLQYPFTVGPHRNLPSLYSAGTLLSLIAFAINYLAYLLIPLSFSFAILRYRLWDIDAIINKALVYGLLTGLLGALYAGLIIGLESLAGIIGGQTTQQPVVLVISTLAIAMLSLPLRRRIQALIDRRFYRRKYDAAKTLAAFSATLRNEVDLKQVREQLLAVVTETMQPAHVSLWLRPLAEQRTEMPHHLESSGPVPIQPSDGAGAAPLGEQALTLSPGAQE